MCRCGCENGCGCQLACRRTSREGNARPSIVVVAGEVGALVTQFSPRIFTTRADSLRSANNKFRGNGSYENPINAAALSDEFLQHYFFITIVLVDNDVGIIMFESECHLSAV